MTGLPAAMMWRSKCGGYAACPPYPRQPLSYFCASSSTSAELCFLVPACLQSSNASFSCFWCCCMRMLVTMSSEHVEVCGWRRGNSNFSAWCTQVLGPKAAAYVLGARNAPGAVARALSRCLIKAVRAPSPVPFWVAQRCEDIITGLLLASLYRITSLQCSSPCLLYLR